MTKNQTRTLIKELSIVVISGLVILIMLSFVAHNLTLKNRVQPQSVEHRGVTAGYEAPPVRLMASVAASTIGNYLDRLTSVDIFMILIAWAAGVFFNRSLHRLAERSDEKKRD